VNTDAPWPSLEEARSRVLEIQTKLHRWATDGPDRRFDDLFNLVCDPAFLTVGWGRVRGNRGARTAGVDDAGGELTVSLRELAERLQVPLDASAPAELTVELLASVGLEPRNAFDGGCSAKGGM
jgi:RNA-directed DNA polymerase